MSSKPKVLFKCPFQDHSGYASVSRKLLLELYKRNEFDLYLEPIVWINSGDIDLPEEEQKVLDELLKKTENLQSHEDVTLIHFSIAPEFFGETSPYKNTIGFTMMETDRTANGWAWKCNQMDAIFVPSNFCLSSFMQSNIMKPIRVIPFGIDFDKYKPEGEKLLKDLPTKFNFLSVGQWLQQGDRKNMMGTLQTFLRLFRETKDVGLILKTYMVGAGTIDKLALESQIKGLRKSMGFKEDEGPHIYLVHGAMEEENMIKLYRNADAFLLPTAGEAWGMPLMEAAAMELPIITTSGTGSEMFLNPEYCTMISYEWKPIGNLVHWPHVYEHYQQFAIPNMEEFGRMVHKVYKHIDLAKERARKQREELIERDFSWASAAAQLSEALKSITGEDSYDTAEECCKNEKE